MGSWRVPRLLLLREDQFKRFNEAIVGDLHILLIVGDLELKDPRVDIVVIRSSELGSLCSTRWIKSCGVGTNIHENCDTL